MASHHSSTPEAERPHLPNGYGLPEDTEGMVPWEDVVRRLTEAENYWVATADSRGRPHSTPVWASFLDGLLYLDGALTTRRGRNLSANPQVAVHLESASEVVIVEGVVRETPIDSALGTRLAAEVTRKYAAKGYSPEPENYTGITMQVVYPHTVFAWTEFPRTVTRFRL